MKNSLSKSIAIFSVSIFLVMICCAQVMGASAFSDLNCEDAVSIVSDIPTTQSFSDEPVSEEDLQTILLAGINAPSAMNKQPWHFSAVTDPAVLEQIAGGMGGGMGSFKPSDGGNPPEGFNPPADFSGGAPSGSGAPGEMPMPPAGAGGGSAKAGVADAPLAIIISCPEGSDFDAGLACQNMSVAAQLLGYGSKIISSPTMVLNGARQAEFREILGIPENYSTVAVLLIGYDAQAGSPDAVTSATVRSPMEEIVTFIEP